MNPEMTEGAIRVSIPAKVANNIDLFEKSFVNLMDKLGCRACCSGFDISFIQQRRYFLTHSPVSTSRQLSQNPVVSLSPRVSYNMDSLLGSIREILGELGCLACCSGFDIRFRQEFDLLINENLEVQAANELRNI